MPSVKVDTFVVQTASATASAGAAAGYHLQLNNDVHATLSAPCSGSVAAGSWEPTRAGVPCAVASLPEPHNDNDNDNDNDTLREVPHQSNEGLALQARVSGP